MAGSHYHYTECGLDNIEHAKDRDGNLPPEV